MVYERPTVGTKRIYHNENLILADNVLMIDDIEVTSLAVDDIDIGGSQTVKIATVNSATYALLVSDYILHVTYTGTGAVAITLPTAQTVNGRVIIVRDAGGNAGTNNITIATEGAETINGEATAVLSGDYDSIMLYCDGSNWCII